MSEIIKIFK